jgi:hypothetical protein
MLIVEISLQSLFRYDLSIYCFLAIVSKPNYILAHFSGIKKIDYQEFWDWKRLGTFLVFEFFVFSPSGLSFEVFQMGEDGIEWNG